jgi:hypothetical protein
MLGLEITRFGPFVTPGGHLLQFNSKDKKTKEDMFRCSTVHNQNSRET